MPAPLPTIVSYVMGGIYVLAGCLKLYPFIPEVSKQMAKDFIAYASVCPSVLLGFHPDPSIYRYSVGTLEIIFGMGLCLCPSSRGKSVNCAGLMVIMLGALHTMISLKDYSLVPVPLICLFGLSFLWMNIPRAAQDGGTEAKKRR